MIYDKIPASELEKIVRTKIKKPEILLDIGCGILPQKICRPQVHICLEPFSEYLDCLQEKIKSEFDRHYVLLKGTWSESYSFIPPKSVDSIFLTDVIEHLPKQEGLRLLQKTEEVARQQIVIFTTLGFLPQAHADGKDAWGLSGADWQEHKSGWLPEDFGDGWDFYISREFHTANNLGQPFEKPYGAFWAIKNLNGYSKPLWRNRLRYWKNMFFHLIWRAKRKFNYIMGKILWQKS